MRSSARWKYLAKYLAAGLALGAPAPGFATPSVTARGTGGATALVLDGQGAATTHIVKVAELSLSTDAAHGLTVSITSGSLTTHSGRPVAFQVVLVDHNAAAPSSSSFSRPSGASYTFMTNAAATVAKDLYIKYTPASLQAPGAYAASIALDAIDN